METLLKLCVLAVLVCGAGSAQSGDPEPLSNRWVELNQFSVGTRLVVFDDGPGGPTSWALQHQEIIEGAFRFDTLGKFSLRAAVADGDSIAAGWSNTGAGSSSGSSYRVNLKKIYLSAKPISGVEIQYGGLGIERGASSAIASYSGDSYLDGARIVVARPQDLFFNEISVTKAWLGDLNAPNMFNRFRRLGGSNYQQYLVAKKFGKRFSSSADYTNQWGSKTVRQAVHIGVAESRIFDAVQFDLYERTNGTRANGFNFGVEKSVVRRISLSGGFTAIDKNYGDLNDDAFFHGDRVYAGANVRVSKSFCVFSLVNRAVDNNYAVPNLTHFHVGINYDLLGAIARTGLFGGKQI
jgi:hypothetical protein